MGCCKSKEKDILVDKKVTISDEIEIIPIKPQNSELFKISKRRKRKRRKKKY